MVSVAVELEPSSGVATRPWRSSIAMLWIAVVAALFVLVGYPMLALDASAWSVVVLAALLAPTLIVAWPLGGLAARPAPRSTDRESQRMPESRNASA